MQLGFSINSNNLNAQVNNNNSCIILNNRIMHRGLPVVVSIGSVNWGSSESRFGISVNSAELTWTLEEKSLSGSWMIS